MEDYPLKPTDADLEQESLDKAEVFAWQSNEPVAVIESEPKAMTVETHEMIVEALEGEIAALRFKAREWEDRARDMERERDDLIESRDLLLAYVDDKPTLRDVVRGFFLR